MVFFSQTIHSLSHWLVREKRSNIFKEPTKCCIHHELCVYGNSFGFFVRCSADFLWLILACNKHQNHRQLCSVDLLMYLNICTHFILYDSNAAYIAIFQWLQLKFFQKCCESSKQFIRNDEIWWQIVGANFACYAMKLIYNAWRVANTFQSARALPFLP